MKSVSTRSVFAFCAMVFSASCLIAADIPPVRTDVPDWAVGVVTVPKLGAALDKTGAYANLLMANSGELAKQIATNFLFGIPVEEGVKKDSPILVYALDPVSTGLKQERAYVLAVLDEAAVKKSLTEVFGAPSEEQGTLKYPIIQAEGPDKFMFVKFVEKRLLAAPSAAVVKKLEEEVTGKADAALAAGTTADLTASIKIPTLKRAFDPFISGGLTMLKQLAGAQPEALNAVTQLLDTVWQLEVLEVRLSYAPDGSSAALEFVGAPQRGTALAKRLAEPTPGMPADALQALPFDSGLYVVFPLDGPKMSGALQPVAPKAGDPNEAMQKITFELQNALKQHLATLSGPARLSFSGADRESSAFVLTATTTDPDAMGKFANLLDAAIAAANANEGPDSWSAKKTSIEHAGAKITKFEVSVRDLPADEKAEIEHRLGGLVLHYASSGKQLFFALGKGGLTALKQAISTETKQSAPSERSKELIANADAANFAASLTPANLGRMLASTLPLTPEVNLERLIQGLTDAQIIVSGKADKVMYLKINLPAAAADAFGTIVQRLERAKVRFRGDGGDAPVPPPPPAK